MSFFSLVCSLVPSWPVALVLLAAVWFVLRKLGDSPHDKHCPDDAVATEEDTSDSYRVVDGMGSPPSQPHLEGTFTPSTGMVYSNGSPFPFENEFCKGFLLPLHRPTTDKVLNKSGDYRYGDHFAGRKRLWEMRLQFFFKSAPPDSMSVGIELEEYVPMGWSTKKAQSLTVRALRKVVGKDLYHSPGDDPKKVSGELEKPVFVMPLWAFDQIIETPEGEEPPSLSDPNLEKMGVKRSDGRADFIRNMSKLKLKSGPTYTLCFWGISQFLDCVKWEIKQIIPNGLDFDKFCGKPPVHMVLYSMEPPAPGQTDQRHLESRKTYYFRLAFWSSLKKPPRRILDRLLAGSNDAQLLANRERRNSLSKGLSSFLTCCVERRKRVDSD